LAPDVIGFGKVTVMGVGARLDLLAVVVAAISNRLEFVDAENIFRLPGHVGELRPI
jgi:hypothetical protein